MAAAIIWAAAGGVLHAQPASALPKAVQSGTPVVFEIWQWDSDAALQKKVMEVKNGMQVSPKQLLAGMQLRFHVPVAHDEVTFTGYLPDNSTAGWGPDKADRSSSESRTYSLGGEAMLPDAGKYCLDVEVKNSGKVVAKNVIIFEILPMVLPKYDGLLSVGYTGEFPKATQSGAPVESNCASLPVRALRIGKSSSI